jgi:nicotinamidase-related amidase
MELHGNTALVVIDVQQAELLGKDAGIPHMPGGAERHARIRELVSAAETLVLVGSLTDVCVHYTFADAHQHDYRCRVVTDCVGGSSLEAHEAALRAMHYLQSDCLVTSDEVLAAFAKIADRPIEAAAA